MRPAISTEKQVEFSRNINSSGSDLLNLINDILDLSKIESGTVTVDIEDISFVGLRENIDRNFRHVAESKNLPFNVWFADDLPRSMTSDPKRLQQILKNLLSNAVKFTSHGHVDVRVSLATQGWTPDHPVLNAAEQVLAFAIEDTGIGVAPEKQRLIFEAFQQADAGTSRKYGGTGLGLAISRELAMLLGGEIKLSSVHGQGSTFTLYLPLRYSSPDEAHARYTAATTPRSLAVLPVAREATDEDDRNDIDDGDPVLLIIEDDPHYARILLGLARDKGFKGIVTAKGAVGITLARQYRPTAISPRHLLAGPARMDGAQPVEARSERRVTFRYKSSLWRRNASTVSHMARSPISSRRRRPSAWRRHSTESRNSPHRAPSDC